jgi:hypothetical protein
LVPAQESLRVQVKGTTGGGNAVVLAAHDVEHARDNYPEVALAIGPRSKHVADDGGIDASDGDFVMWC